MDVVTLSSRCDQHARLDAEQSREVIDVGPFRALISHNTDLIWLNYAVPLGPLGPPAELGAALNDLGRVFAERGRTLRLEFNALPWPALPVALEQFGLSLQAEQPLMVCAPETLVAFAAPGIATRLLDATATDAEARAYLAILRVSFSGEERETTADEVSKLRSSLADQNLRGVAFLDGELVGVASLSPIGDVAELTGVATAPAARRRGVAATLSRFMTEEHFRRGGAMAWLSAGDEAAEATYRKIGFQLIDKRLNYIQQAP